MSVVTIGYWSGYLSGLLAGTAVGWILSIMRTSNSVEEETVDESSDEEILNTEESKTGENIIYFRLTDKSLANILRLKEANFTFEEDETTPVDTETPATNEDQREVPEVFRPVEIEINNDELAGIFEEEDKIKSRTVEETLDIGRNMPARPVAFLTSVGGGYATMNQIETMGKKHTEYKEATLGRSEELEIIHAFRGIVGSRFYDVQGGVKAQGYSLHPLYVGDGPKRQAQYYSATTLGVRIKDEDFNSGIPSVNAVITEIVDVGGMDYKDRGLKRN